MKNNISYIQAPITNKTPSASVSLETIHTAITTNDSYKKITEDYRKILKDPKKNDKEVRKAKVHDFDYVTMSGTFDYVSSSKLIEHSGLICIDIDKLESDEEVESVRDTLLEDPLIDTALIFVSPGGKGLKWTVGITVDPIEPQKSNLDYFRAIQSYLRNQYSIEIDESCKDVSRACFLCYDDNAYLNKDYTSLTEDFLEQWGVPDLKFNVANKTVSSDKDTPWEEYNERGDVRELLAQYGYTFVKSEGTGDKYLRPGNSTSEYSLIVFKDTGMVHVHSDSCHNLPPGTYTPARVFCNLEAGGDWRLAAKLLKAKGFVGSIDEKSFNILSGASLPSSATPFWSISKEKKGEFKCGILTHEFHQFCHEVLGIGRVKVPGKAKANLVRSVNRVVEHIITDDVFDSIVHYLETHIKPYNREMFTIVYNTFYTYWHSQKLDRLVNAMRVIKLSQLEEVPGQSYLYFQNGYLDVTKDGYDFYSYEKLTTHIWKGQIIDRNWQGKASYLKSDWYDFCRCISGNDDERFEHLRMTYGYLLHSFKDRANPKAVILVDEELKEDLTKASGGTGKSIAARAVKLMKNTVEIAGKTWDPTSRFAFSQVNHDHKVMWIDDAQPNLKFDMLYNAITQDFEIEGKGINRISIPFEISPKLLISTNHPIKGDDDSSVRRQHVVEIAPYFSKDYTAKDKYGRRLIEEIDWEDSDWNQFDNFMVDCLVDYLKNGLKDLEINYRYKRTIDQITPELFEWLEETIVLGEFYTTSELLHGRKPKSSIDGFCTQYPDIKKSSRWIGADMEVYCNYKGLYLHKERRDKRGYIFLKEEPT